MTTNDSIPTPDGDELAELRATIDELTSTPIEELIEPLPSTLVENEPTPEVTDAIGSEKWDEPAEDEVTEV